MQVWRRSTKPCAVQGGAEFPTWNTHANPQQREAHLPTRNTEKGNHQSSQSLKYEAYVDLANIIAYTLRTCTQFPNLRM